MNRWMLLFIALAVVLSFSVVSAEQFCKDIYCNDFNYICCGQKPEERYYDLEIDLKTKTPKTGQPTVFCPADSDVIKCIVNLHAAQSHIDPNYDFYVGTGSCENIEEETGFFTTDKRWKCEESEKSYDIPSGETWDDFTLEAGQKIYCWSDDSITISPAYVYRMELRHTGKSTDFLSGQKVEGSTACDFNPRSYDKVYDNEQDIVSGKRNLELGQCYSVTDYSLRRQCGDTCDECESDVNCADLYPKKVNYNGRTLGAVCSSGQLVLYGCEGTGNQVCIEKDILPDGTEKCMENKERKHCDIVSRITTGIECCTSDDCQGVGDYFCNWIDDTHSKCELKAQCEKDSDCGTATKCDRNTMEITQPYCDDNKQCDIKTLQEVECCIDTDCRDGFYCTSDHICNDKPQAKAVPVKDGNGYSSSNNGKSKKITGQAGLLSGSSLIAIILGVVLVVGGALFFVLRKKPTDDFGDLGEGESDDASDLLEGDI